MRHYAVWNGFRPNGSPEAGNYTTPYGVAASLAMPTRSFAVPEAGSASSCKSIQYFVNIDASLRANGGAGFGDLDFGPSTRFGFMDGDQGWTQQIFAIPQIQQRRTRLTGTPALGATVVFRHVMPPGLPGHVAGFLVSMPFAGVLPVSIPGISVEGSLLVDPTALPILGLQVTDSVSRPTLQFSIPSTPALIGMQLECQSLDFAPTLTLYLAGNDVTLTVVAN